MKENSEKWRALLAVVRSNSLFKVMLEFGSAIDAACERSALRFT
jgi:hypothetical protein